MTPNNYKQPHKQAVNVMTTHCAVSMCLRESDLGQVLRKSTAGLINSRYKG